MILKTSVESINKFPFKQKTGKESARGLIHCSLCWYLKIWSFKGTYRDEVKPLQRTDCHHEYRFTLQVTQLVTVLINLRDKELKVQTDKGTKLLLKNRKTAAVHIDLNRNVLFTWWRISRKEIPCYQSDVIRNIIFFLVHRKIANRADIIYL